MAHGRQNSLTALLFAAVLIAALVVAHVAAEETSGGTCDGDAGCTDTAAPAKGAALSDPFRMSLSRFFRDPFFDVGLPMFNMERAMAASPLAAWSPKCDIKETDDAIVVTAELPGLSPDDVHVQLQDGVLSVSGERKFEKEETKDNYHRVERSYGSFSRAFVIPTDKIDADAVAAEFDRGVLHVTVPKVEKIAGPKKIEITTKE